jgi:hypothetical protein
MSGENGGSEGGIEKMWNEAFVSTYYLLYTGRDGERM